MLGNAPPLLDYGHRSRPRWGRRVTLLFAVGIIAVAGWKWRKPIRARVELHYWQHRCATWSAPADRVAYEPDSVLAPRLAKLPEYVQPEFDTPPEYGPQTHPSVMPFAILRPTCWIRYVAQRPSLVDFQDDAIVFLHALRSAGGHQRLVMVVVQDVSVSTSELQASVYELKSLFYKADPPAPSPGGGPGLFGGGPPDDTPNDPMDWVLKCPMDQLRVFVGQADSVDESHFTVRYQFRSTFGTIDGWLQDNDTVKFRNQALQFSTTRPTVKQIFQEMDDRAAKN